MTNVCDELLALQLQSDDGLLHVNEVHDWALEHEESALHQSLEWDDARAAREHRFEQIRRLIRIHVVSEQQEPKLVSLSFDRARGGGYRPVETVLQSHDLSAVMLQDALSELTRIQKRYQRVLALTSVWHEIDSVRRQTATAAAAQQEAG